MEDMEKRWRKMSASTIDKVNKIKSEKSAHRLGLTELTRSKAWRQILNENDILEIVDRTETAGFILSQEGLDSIIEFIESLEEELEEKRVDAIFEARKNLNNWMSGEELAQKAVESFNKNEEKWRAITDGDRS